MTWFAVPNDLVGNWVVADRRVPTSELNLRDCAACGHEVRHHDGTNMLCAAEGCGCAEFEPVDTVICYGCKSQEDARLIAAALNYVESLALSDREMILRAHSVPWPEAEEEA